MGVYRGQFAAKLLDACADIERYYMIDPWRHLEDWNKPANQPDDIFEQFYGEVMDKTAAYADKYRDGQESQCRPAQEEAQEGRLSRT